MRPKTAISLILLVLVLITIFQNTEVVGFTFLFWDLYMSRIIWLLIILVVGFAAGYLTGSRTGGTDKQKTRP